MRHRFGQVDGDQVSGRRTARRRRRSRPAGRPTSRRTCVGKSATTSTRYGSATSSATALYSSIVAYSLRRYFCVTISMWAARSASRSSICRGSVQTWLVTSAPSKSARCMNAPKLRPMPIGSTIVNRTWAGGKLVNSRNIDAWSTASAAARPSAGVSINRLAPAGNGLERGEIERRRHALHQSGVGRHAMRQGGELERDRPKRTTGGTTRGNERSAQDGSFQAGQ